MNYLWKQLFYHNIIFDCIFFHCLFCWRVMPCCDWLQCEYWLDTRWSTDIHVYCCFLRIVYLCCKWMYWNLMRVELCGNYFCCVYCLCNIVLVRPVWTICLDMYIFVWASLRSEGYNSACHGKQEQVWNPSDHIWGDMHCSWYEGFVS